jgi:hypothetical protein
MKIDTSKLTTELIKELCKDENAKEILINNGVIKNELELNRWYKCLDMGNLIYYKSNEKDNYGLSYYKKEWSNDLIFQKAYNYKLATPQEVETALKNEAVKKYKVGDKIKNHQGDFILENLDIIYTNKHNDGIYINQSDGVWLMLNGVWSEIIPQEETYIKIPLSIITLTDSDKKLGALVRSISEKY